MQVTGLSQFFTMFLKVRLQGEHTLQYCLCASHGACSLVSAKGLADKDMDENLAAACVIVAERPVRAAKGLQNQERHFTHGGEGTGKAVCRYNFAGARPAFEGQRRPSANPILVPRTSPLFPGAVARSLWQADPSARRWRPMSVLALALRSGLSSENPARLPRSFELGGGVLINKREGDRAPGARGSEEQHRDPGGGAS